jgi:hypothetical protein
VLEPRTALDLLSRSDLKYIGGVERLDLWATYKWSHEDMLPSIDLITKVRVHVVGDSRYTWDVFKLPLRDNTKTDSGLIGGHRFAVLLTPEEVNLVETYLRCFAPWVLASRSEEGGLTNE